MSFSRYAPEDSVISSETVVTGLWTGNSNTLSTFYTSSANPGGEYYLDVYQANPTTNSTASVQFDVQYGNLNGSGSLPVNLLVPGNTPSRIVYGQYRNLVYGTETVNFSFDGVTTPNDVYFININRSNYKQSLQPGSLNLFLTSGSNTIQLTDDSNTTSLTRFAGENVIYYLISGSSGNAYTSSAATTYYGMVVPNLGIIVLNGTGSQAAGTLGKYIKAPSQLTNAAQNNQVNLYNSISASSALNVNYSFQLQSQEVISSTYFFTRVKNSEFNYTSNPSIIDNSGNLLYSTLINNPQTFITTVGLYNDNNDLLAVAKLSQPLVKDFTKESLLRIKLDY
jgi:hypothetical protein